MTSTMRRVSQLWDLIETWGFCEDIKDIVANDDHDDNDNNDKDGNNDKGISALGLDRHGVFAWMTLMTSLIFLYSLNTIFTDLSYTELYADLAYNLV